MSELRRGGGLFRYSLEREPEYRKPRELPRLLGAIHGPPATVVHDPFFERMTVSEFVAVESDQSLTVAVIVAVILQEVRLRFPLGI